MKNPLSQLIDRFHESMNGKDARPTIARPPLARGFHLPRREDLLSLRPGDYVKLVFTDGSKRERMWVKLIDCSFTDAWEGSLANQPVHIEGLNFGDTGLFHPLDVIDCLSNQDVQDCQEPNSCNSPND